MNFTDHIEQIVQKSKESALSGKKLKALAPNVKPLTDFLNCTHNQAVLFSIIFYLTLERGSADLSDLANHFEVPVMRLLKYKHDLDQLTKKKLIRQEDSRGPFTSRAGSFSYYVHHSILDGILKKKLVGNPGMIKDNFDFLVRAFAVMEDATDNGGGYEILKDDLMTICKENKKLTIAKKILGSDMNEYEVLILIFVAYKLLNGEDDIPISEACYFLDNDKHFQLSVRRSLLNGNSSLLKRGLIETTPGMFRNENDLNITDKGLEYLLGADAEQLSLKSQKVKTEILPEKIRPVKLFLNHNEKQQMQAIQGLFEKENFNGIVERMKDKNMKAGFTVLLYGDPGTGKTESVYQLARETGRSILPVEISQTKSMWFGESEKLIKGVFESYRRLQEGSRDYPILLFNEADGIFGKRTTNMESGVSQTLNAMQNIILQEMEDFEGLMIATTNLTDNLDKAFDRRFLYKVKFEIPDLNTRIQIMQEKIPFLSPCAIGQLCEQFKLTGGQMANIAKKCNIHELLGGSLPNLQQVGAFCREELGLTTKTKLGF
ncbi:MAG TPA: ATP-binding protein [Bacteroidales bacterium]|nr:ATP-binding protein [Bacteroidales bacterium]